MNPDAPRDEPPVANGVNFQDAAGCTGDSPKPSDQPSQEPSVQPTTLDLVVDPPVSDAFDAFWTAYPRHVGKGAARKAWTTATKAALPSVIIAGAERFRDDPNRVDQFTPHPTTWLRAERWCDDPLPPRGTPRGTPPPEIIDADRDGFEGVVEL